MSLLCIQDILEEGESSKVKAVLNDENYRSIKVSRILLFFLTVAKGCI